MAAKSGLGWFLDAGALLDDVVGHSNLLMGEVEAVFP
jgi:hypothetical protein